MGGRVSERDVRLMPVVDYRLHSAGGPASSRRQCGKSVWQATGLVMILGIVGYQHYHITRSKVLAATSVAKATAMRCLRWVASLSLLPCPCFPLSLRALASRVSFAIA